MKQANMLCIPVVLQIALHATMLYSHTHAQAKSTIIFWYYVIYIKTHGIICIVARFRVLLADWHILVRTVLLKLFFPVVFLSALRHIHHFTLVHLVLKHLGPPYLQWEELDLATFL